MFRKSIDPAEAVTADIPRAEVTAEIRRRHSMPLRTKILFWVIAWAIVLMPFLFWRSTWFGRPLPDKELSDYIQDDAHPRHVQHALVQIGERMSNHRPGTDRWYPDLVRLANYPVEEVRNTDAWVMGQDTSRPEFHQALLKMLGDSSLTVRGNAALSLVRFGDDTGRPQILEMLQPATVTAPVAGTVTGTARSGEAVNHGSLLVKIDDNGAVNEVRSPITGKIKSIVVAPGSHVDAGTNVAVVNPGTDQVWEALRGLYVVGKPEDLGVVRIYERDNPDLAERVVQQAKATEQEILKRAK